MKYSTISFYTQNAIMNIVKTISVNLFIITLTLNQIILIVIVVLMTMMTIKTKTLLYATLQKQLIVKKEELN
jgi:hypothetical protein